MRRTVPLKQAIGLICGGLAALVAASAGATGAPFDTLTLTATNYNAGNVGKAVLAPQGDKTAIKIELSGVPDYIAKPTHVYAYIYDGTCGSHSAAARYKLTNRVLASSPFHPKAIGVHNGPVQIGQDIPVNFQALRESPFAIIVRTSPVDGDREIYCGDNAR